MSLSMFIKCNCPLADRGTNDISAPPAATTGISPGCTTPNGTRHLAFLHCRNSEAAVFTPWDQFSALIGLILFSMPV